CQLRQLLHGLLLPELIVTMVVILIVQTVESGFFPIVQGAIDEVVLYTDTRMIFMGFLSVRYKQYVTDKCIASVTNPDAVLICFSGEESLYFTLGIEFGTHAVHLPSFGRLDTGLFNIIGMWTE